MSDERLSLKGLDVRVKALEDLAYAESENPPEWLDDVLVGVISALFQLRQQGAYTLAKSLEAKYFPDGGVDEIGDEFTTSTGLNRSRLEK